MNDVNPASLAPLVASGGFLLALIFGFVGAKTNFCTMGAVSDIVNIGEWSRMRMWALAIAVAILGASALDLAGLANISSAFYASPNFTWLSYLVGGFLFGFGMVLGSGCGSKTLMRIGTGNLKSVLVLVFLAIAAYMTLRGLFAPFRVGVLDKVAITLAGTQDLPSMFARFSGIARPTLLVVFALVIAGALLAFVFARAEGRANDVLLGGIVIGLVIVGGWYVTGYLGYVAEHPDSLKEAWVGTNSGRIESLTFVGPQAYSLELLMLWSDKSKIVTFGIASVAGVILGSFLYAITSGNFRLEGFREPEDMVNHMAAGVLMGFGGVTALGCTVGQGLSGVSTLALGSFLTLAAIIAGAIAAFKYQYWRIENATA